MPKLALRHKQRAAFTLYELVITMALFLFVAGLVLSFISFMSRFTARNDELGAVNEKLTDVRREIDFWLSYFDSDRYELELPAAGTGADSAETGERVVLTAVTRAEEGSFGKRYEMRLALLPVAGSGEEEIFSYVLILSYPETAQRGEVYESIEGGETVSSRQVRLGLDGIYAVRFSEPEPDREPAQIPEKQVLRFVCELPVTDRRFACEIIYA